MKTGYKTNLFFFATPETGRTESRCGEECQTLFEEQLNAVRVIRLEQRGFAVPAPPFHIRYDPTPLYTARKTMIFRKILCFSKKT